MILTSIGDLGNLVAIVPIPVEVSFVVLDQI